MTHSFVAGEAARCTDERDPSNLLAQVLEPFTRAMFAEAGLSPGMHVMTMCSGSGDVAFLARDFVGKAGRVLGFDSSPGSVDYANERAAYRGFTNVQFVVGKFEDSFGSDTFDAIVGRLMLMYRSHPKEDVAAVLKNLRPGGLVALQELDMTAASTLPEARQIEIIREWVSDVCCATGIDRQMGPKLHSILTAAGLFDPQMRVDGLIGASDSILPRLLGQVADVLTNFIPMQILGEPHSDAGTLEEQLRADLDRTRGVMSSALLISAWARRLR